MAGEATDRVFFVREGATVVIRGMTIRHGNPDLEPKVLGIRRCGGGIANNGEEDCIVGDRGRSMKGYGLMVLNLNNLIERGDCPSRFLGDPLLGPLADNGGSTQTHALRPRSPVIDEVECDLATDQRGEPRQGDACDLGAFEVQTDG